MLKHMYILIISEQSIILYIKTVILVIHYINIKYVLYIYVFHMGKPHTYAILTIGL